MDDAMQELATIKTQYDVLVQDMDEINKRRKVAVLQKAKIIGMTTTVSSTSYFSLFTIIFQICK